MHTIATRLSTAIAASWLLMLPAAAAPNVVVSIKPIQSLTAALMQNVSTPSLIVDNNDSPHTFSLRPSDAQTLQNADLVVWVGPDLEAFLPKPLETLAADADVLELDQAPGITLLPTRDIDLDDEEAHDHEEDGDHEGEEHHHHGPVDMHLWLDPANAAAIANAITAELQKIDPENADTYATNLNALQTELADLDQTLRDQLAGSGTGRPIVYHDAFQYFQHAFGLDVAGAVSINPEIATSAAHLADLIGIVKANQADCVFVEPQFEPRLAQALAEQGGIKTIEADPLGSQFPTGPDQYAQLLHSLASAFADCR